MPGYGTIEELVAEIELTDIRIWEEGVQSGNRRLEIDTSDEASPAHDGRLEFKVAAFVGESELRFRFRLSFSDAAASYIADVESQYFVPDGCPSFKETDRAIIQDFSERVAFMATYPVIRASIFGAAGRLGLERPLLPLIKSGQFRAGGQLTAEEMREAFGVGANA